MISMPLTVVTISKQRIRRNISVMLQILFGSITEMFLLIRCLDMVTIVNGIQICEQFQKLPISNYVGIIVESDLLATRGIFTHCLMDKFNNASHTQVGSILVISSVTEMHYLF